jgi:hypothetical protein
MKRAYVAAVLAGFAAGGFFAAPSLAEDGKGETGTQAASGGEPAAEDRAYAAFQRGRYLTAYREALPLAEAGNPASQTLLGELYSKGLGVGLDLKQAERWYRAAAAQGDAAAQNALGLILLDEKDAPFARHREGMEFLEKAAAKGNVEAHFRLGQILILGELGPLDPEAAAKHFTIAAEKGHAEAQYSLGTLYSEGAGVPPDPEAAALWTGRAAQQGLSDAQLEYGIMVFKGRGVTKDETLGATWILRAAEQGNPVAQNRIANLYANGRGVIIDPVEAAKWHLIARANGAIDFWLDGYLASLSDENATKARAEAAAWQKTTSLAAPPF